MQTCACGCTSTNTYTQILLLFCTFLCFSSKLTPNSLLKELLPVSSKSEAPVQLSPPCIAPVYSMTAKSLFKLFISPSFLFLWLCRQVSKVASGISTPGFNAARLERRWSNCTMTDYANPPETANQSLGCVCEQNTADLWISCWCCWNVSVCNPTLSAWHHNSS